MPEFLSVLKSRESTVLPKTDRLFIPVNNMLIFSLVEMNYGQVLCFKRVAASDISNQNQKSKY